MAKATTKKKSKKSKAAVSDDEFILTDDTPSDDVEDSTSESAEDSEAVQSIASDDEDEAPEIKRKDETGALRKDIEKKYGKGVIYLASESKCLEIARFPTELLCLDHVLGGGYNEEGVLSYGLPRGYFTSFYGDESTGKTTTALLTAAAVQRCCRVCSTRITKKHGCICGKNEPCHVAWWDAEGVWQNSWAKDTGIDLNALTLIRTKTAEDGVDVTRILLDSNKIDLLVVDSIACLTPQKELENSMDKATVGEAARLVNRAIRIWTRLISTPDRPPNQQPAIILINQLRMKVGMMYGNPETRPGGRGQFFAEGIALRFGSGQYHFLKDDGTEIAQTNAADEASPAWRDVKFTSTKNKTAPPRLSGIYQLWLSDHTYLGQEMRAGEISEIDPLWAYGNKYGLIEKRGGKWHCGKLIAGSKDGLKQKLAGSAAARNALKKALLGRLLK